MRTKKQKLKGIIVWDFDRVLFDTDRMVDDNNEIFAKYDISPELIRSILDKANIQEGPFSWALLVRRLKNKKKGVPLNSIKREMQSNLLSGRYVRSEASKVLKNLKSNGFANMLLSFGSPPYQYQKIKKGCGPQFCRYFDETAVTLGKKYLKFRSLVKKFSNIPIFFIDDTNEHLAMVKKHTPSVHTLQYSAQSPLGAVEEWIHEQVQRYDSSGNHSARG